MTEQAGSKARYIMIGGFLGAGKTTAIAALARRLANQGVRTGLISNDQSTGLVDTAMLRSQGFRVEEIPGGCFCCRFDSLVDASEKLGADAAPEVFIAEPVGSCTDLVATVAYPLRRIYGEHYVIAPFSVLVDPIRAARIFGLADGRPFSDKVVYIYKKQLEEADYIVINKCDSIDAELRGRLSAVIEEQFPKARVVQASVRDGQGVDAWFASILSEECDTSRSTMELDYALYGAGEALLGWLNATIRIHSKGEFAPNQLLLNLASEIRSRIDAESGEIAHLKMTFDGDDIAGKLAVVSLVRSDGEPELRESLPENLCEGTLILNLRAESSPEQLRRIAEETLQGMAASEKLDAKIEHLESFRPGQPNPVHRITV